MRTGSRGGPKSTGTRDAARRLVEVGLLGRFTAREVVLFASVLTPSGAVHTPLAAFPLEGEPSTVAAVAGGGSAGRLLAIEGLDGSGGTTQVGRLAAALRDRGLEVLVTGEPSRGPIGGLVRASLRRTSEVGEAVLPYLFAADRRDHLDREILPALARGAWVVTDRFLASSLAYQSLAAPFEHVSALNARFPLPDLTILLVLDPVRCLERVTGRGQERERFEDLDHLHAIEVAYDRALVWTEARGGPVARVDAAGSVDEVAAAVWRVVETRLHVPASCG
jgi:dTMP kinase